MGRKKFLPIYSIRSKEGNFVCAVGTEDAGICGALALGELVAC